MLSFWGIYGLWTQEGMDEIKPTTSVVMGRDFTTVPAKHLRGCLLHGCCHTVHFKTAIYFGQDFSDFGVGKKTIFHKLVNGDPVLHP